MLLSACCILMGGSLHITESAHFINILVRYTDFIIARRKLDSADIIDNVNHGIEVNTCIIVNRQFVVVLDGSYNQRTAAICAGCIQFFHTDIRDICIQVTHKGCHVDLFCIFIDGHQNHGIGVSIPRFVTTVNTDQQNVVHVIVVWKFNVLCLI